MYEIKKYRFCFDRWAFALFALIMLPNISWFIRSGSGAPLAALQARDILPAVDAAASITRVLMVACLCLLKNTDALPVRPRALLCACALCVLAYYAMWQLYSWKSDPCSYSVPEEWGLCIFPCAAFILFSIDRKNLPALAFALVFTVCHGWCTGACLRAVWGY